MVALVITIVILIILATVSINAIFGDNGLIQSAEKGKKEQEKAEARERLELVLSDAYAEKHVAKEKYNENEYLDEFIYSRELDAEVTEAEISLNGYTFELDRSVPQLGEYIGEAGNLPPTIRNIKVIGKTETSAKIEVTVARGEGVKYKYSIKKANEGDESYTQAVEKAENIYEFTGLENTGTNTRYTAKVELVKDGQVVDTENIEIIIGKLESGVVRFEAVVWKDGEASVKILTEEKGYTLQYQINGIEAGSWKDIASESRISGLHHNDTVYGRLWNGIDESEPASIEIKDTVVPVVNFITDKTDNSIKVTVNATDKESGLDIYVYYLNGGNPITKNENTHIFSELKENTPYTIKVEVKDKANNTGIKQETVTTSKKLATNVSELKEGEYVNYVDKKGIKRKCVVLYDNSSDYGIQIITMDGVEKITIGDSSNFTNSMQLYNNAISILNDAAMTYNNTIYSSDARSVGSVPNNKNSQGGTHWPEFSSDYVGKFRDKDTNYLKDYQKMEEINGGIHSIGKEYWLASRDVDSGSRGSVFRVRFVFASGELDVKHCGGIYIGNSIGNGNTNISYLRPVFTLKSGIKVTGGNGMESSPYELDV